MSLWSLFCLLSEMLCTSSAIDVYANLQHRFFDPMCQKLVETISTQLLNPLSTHTAKYSMIKVRGSFSLWPFSSSFSLFLCE